MKDQTTNIRDWTWKRWFIALTTVLMAVYSLAVLWYVQQVPEIGLISAFRPVVNRVYPEHLQAEDEQIVGSLTGATVVQVGDVPISSWPQLLRTIEQLNQDSYPEVQNLSAAKSSFARFDDNNWVRVHARTEAGEIISVWCRVGHIPAAVILPSMLWFALEMGLFIVAAVLYWKRLHDSAARLFFVQILVVIGAYMGGYHWARIALQPVLLGIYTVCAVLLPAVTLHFFLVFPRPKACLLTRPVMTRLLLYGPPAVFLLAIAAGYALARWLSRGGAPADQVARALASLRSVIFTYFLVALAWYFASIVALIHSYRTARDAGERNQVRWILFGSVMALVPLGYTLYLAHFRPAEFGGGAAIWPMFGFSTCFTLAFTISFTRHRFMQFDQLLNFGLAYFLVSCMAALAYCVLVFIGMLLLGIYGPSGPTLEQAFWVSGSALMLTIGLDLTRSRLRRFLENRFRRHQHQLDHTLQQLGRAVDQLVDPPTLGSRFLQAIADMYGVAQGAVYLRTGDPPIYRLAGSLGKVPSLKELSADSPLPAALLLHDVLTANVPFAGQEPSRAQLRDLGGEVALALNHEGALRAILVLGPKPEGRFHAEELSLLEAFAPFTALALAGADGRHTIEVLNRELQTKVEKISEQQRRIFALQQQLLTQARRVAPVTADPVASDNGNRQAMVSALVGSSPALQKVLEMVPRVAASPSAVLIRGESGTGKELIAKAIHDNSPRAAESFVKVHCAALAPGILESELFGHVKGAFTGALRDKVGRFELAHKGTLFLDEIGDITLDVQSKLLRVLQEKTFERVGSSESIQVDVRLVAATHQNLEQLIRQGRFREDLYYRLNVIPLAIPPLRDRGEDVLELAQHFLNVYGRRSAKAVQQIDDDALLALRAHRWPGNVRELENAIERAVVVAQGPIIGFADLPPELQQNGDFGIMADGDMEGYVPVPELWAVRAERQARNVRERDSLLRAVEAARGNKAEAARALGMARSTLISRMKRLGMLKPGEL